LYALKLALLGACPYALRILNALYARRQTGNIVRKKAGLLFQESELSLHKGQILPGEEQSFRESFQTNGLFGYFPVFLDILSTTFDVVPQDHG
jgi:hypothetical protein